MNMQFFDKNPDRFRIFFALLVFVLLSLAGVSIFRFASSPTDENIFRTSPSDLYVTRSIPAQLIKQQNLKEGFTDTQVDSIHVGDLILNINDRLMSRAKQLQRLLNKIPEDSLLNIFIFRPSQSAGFTYLVRRGDIPDSSFRDIPATVYISDVTPGGASDRAGLQVGDLIYKINNLRFKDEREAQKILLGGKSGNTLAYDVIRKNKTLTLSITLANIGIRLSALALILSGLAFMALGIFVGITRPEFKAARLMGLSFVSLGFFLTIFLPYIVDRFLPNDTFLAIRHIFVLFCVFFSFPFWLHMCHYFPIEREELQKRRWIRYTSYGIAALFFLLTISTGNIRFVPIGILLLLLFNNIQFFFRKERSEEYKKFHRTIFRASIIVASSIGIMFLGLIIMNYLKQSGYQPPISPLFFNQFFSGYFGTLLMLIPFSYLYTIGHYRLLNLDLRVKRNIQYQIVSVLWNTFIIVFAFKAIFYLSTIPLDLPNIKIQGSFLEIIDQPMSPQEQHQTEKLAMIFLGLIFIWGLVKFRRSGQRYIDRKFDRAQFDYRKAANELAEVMSTHITMMSLANGIAEKLLAVMQIQRIGVMFFKDESHYCCSIAKNMPTEQWQQLSQHFDQETIQTIKHQSPDFRYTLEVLPENLQSSLEAHLFKHLLPIRSKDKLVGIILIGEKLSETPFNKDDLMFLTTIGKQAAVAIENAFLYNELAEQERLKHELNIARRIQLASLPQLTPIVKGLDIAGISIPAQEVGGDFYDYLTNDDSKITIIVGDVSGKGTSAALYMSKIQGIMRSLNDFNLSPAELLTKANRLLVKDLEKQSFITAMSAEFDTNAHKIRLARAGHSPLYHYCAATQKVHIHIPKGIGLGLTSSDTFVATIEETELAYHIGDVFVLITDGITEAQNPQRNEFGEELLIDLLLINNRNSAKRLRDSIISAVNQFADTMPQYDDLTVVVVKVTE
jgi:serine phosphatase RsbU (regulator of sigma subunit)